MSRALLISLWALWGCGPEGDPVADAGAVDVGVDRGRVDGPLDMDPGDGMPPDMMPSDFARPDGMPPDALPLDALPIDMASLDALPPDMPSLDATPPDMAPEDAGLPDLPVLPVVEACVGGGDEDEDGLIDCADPDCRPSGACFHTREDCGNGVDDDGDLRPDCEDRYCVGHPACPPPEVEPFTAAELQDRFDHECLHCHGPVEPFSSLDLSAPFTDAVVDVLSVQIPSPLVKPGDRQESFLYLKLSWHHLDAGGDGEGMPPPEDGPPWSAVDIERLGRWIDGLGTQ